MKIENTKVGKKAWYSPSKDIIQPKSKRNNLKKKKKKKKTSSAIIFTTKVK